jgi:cytoskeletal protein RodZ
MKRCPFCEFIYEDDQSHCEMDGIALIHDDHALPLQDEVAVAALPADLMSNPRRKKTRLLPLSALLVGIVLLLVQYAGANRGARSAPNVDPPSPPQPAAAEVEPAMSEGSDAPTADLPLAETPAPQTSTNETPTSASSSNVGSSARAPENEASTTPMSTQPGAASPAKPAKTRRVEKAPTSAKKESKFRSLLNKTTRVLKKPFTTF